MVRYLVSYFNYNESGAGFWISKIKTLINFIVLIICLLRFL